MIRISVVINYVCHGKLVCVSCGWPLIVWWHILIDEFYACCRCMLGCLVYILVDRLVFAVVVCLVHILIDEFYACCRCMFGCLVHILIDEFYACCRCMFGCLVAHSDRRVLCLLSLYAWLFGVHSCR